MIRPRPLTTAKWFYFFFYAAWACLLPFLVLYYRQLGFSGAQIGLLASISPLASLLAAPLWGALADATRRHHQVLLLTVGGAAVTVFGLSYSRSYGLLLLLVTVYAFFNAPIIAIVDSSVMELLGSRRDDYGRVRLWGAVGWGMAGPAAGALVEQFGLSMSFVLYIALSVGSFVSAWLLPVRPQPRAEALWRSMGTLLKNGGWTIFLLACYISGITLGVINNYLFLYLDELGASSTQMGFALTMATISETIVLFFSGWLLRRFGTRGLLMISLAAFVLRAFGYSAAQAPWQALLFQLFHGLTFSTLWVAGVRFASENAPPGLSATAQSLFSATVMGFGGITGALVGGAAMDVLGGAGLFRASAVVVLAALLLFVLAGRFRTAANTG